MSFAYRHRKFSSILALASLLIATTAAPVTGEYDPKLGRWLQRDPIGTGVPLQPALTYHAANPTVSVSMAHELQYGDGMNFYEFVRSNAVNHTDPSGFFSLIDFSSYNFIRAEFGLFSFAAAHPLAARLAGGLLAAANLYAFAQYEEVQAIVVAEPDPLGFLAGQFSAIRTAIGELTAARGSIVGLRRLGQASRSLVGQANDVVQGLAKTGGQGGLYVVPGGTYTASERRAAEYVASLGRDVVLRPPSGRRAAGGTSDLLVNGLPYDVYTPINENASRIIDGIARKKNQAVGVVVDLSLTSVSVSALGDVMARLRGKGVTAIQEIIFIPK